MHQSLWRELWILVGIAAASLLLGLVTGRPFLVAAIGYGLYIASTLRHLRHLHQWLLRHKRGEIPDAEGLWGDVFSEIRKLEKQTERREDRLTGMITRFQNAAGVMPDAVVILSQRDDIEWSNPASRGLLGIHFPRDTGMRLSNLLRNPDFTRYLILGEFTEPLEIASPVNPEMALSIQIIPFGSSQKLILGRDVTRLFRLEQMRRTFVANVSHEMRTPLTVLAGYIETLAQMKNFKQEDLKKHLVTMHEQAERLQRLVGDLLTLSKLETEPPRRHEETVDVPTMLAGLKEQAEILSGQQQHTVTLEIDSELRLIGNKEELHSAFSNLINNAVRHTPNGGTIKLRWSTNGQGAKFSVADTGGGIAREHIPHITERFYRVDTARSRATGGTGLGLSIVKHVLLRHDAQLHVESDLGKGSIFTCIFPVARVSLPAAARQ
jgi:two-component system, OmpR family, phosphate regulon sensor histidine kinase PhoR